MPIQAVKRPRLAWITSRIGTQIRLFGLLHLQLPRGPSFRLRRKDRSRRRTRVGTSFRLRRNDRPGSAHTGTSFAPRANDRPGGTRAARLVADAAYHRRPYFAGVLRARATSQPLATLRDMLTLPILFYCPPGPSSRQQGYHTPYGGILQVLSQRFWGKFFRFYSSAPIFFMRLSTMSPTLARSSAVKA